MELTKAERKVFSKMGKISASKVTREERVRRAKLAWETKRAKLSPPPLAKKDTDC